MLRNAPKYMIAYANSKMDATWNNELMKDRYKIDTIRKIDRIVFAYRIGDVTENEAMALIAEA